MSFMAKDKNLIDDIFGPLPPWAEWLAIILFLFVVLVMFIRVWQPPIASEQTTGADLVPVDVRFINLL